MSAERTYGRRSTRSAGPGTAGNTSNPSSAYTHNHDPSPQACSPGHQTLQTKTESQLPQMHQDVRTCARARTRPTTCAPVLFMPTHSKQSYTPIPKRPKKSMFVRSRHSSILSNGAIVLRRSRCTKHDMRFAPLNDRWPVQMQGDVGKILPRKGPKVHRRVYDRDEERYGHVSPRDHTADDGSAPAIGATMDAKTRTVGS
jgi:hypothetical protein